MAAAAEDTGTEKESVFDQLTGTQKSAILMMLIGEDEASEILRNLSPREVQHLGTAMYSVQGLDQETVNLVLDEFLAIIKAQTSLGMGAGNYIRNVMVKALGEDKSQSVLSRIAPSASARPIEILEWMDARSISELIADEHPQIIAVVISYLDAGLGADVLGLLPENLQSEVIRRIATLQTVGPDALRELEQVMQKKFKANTSLRASQVGGVDAAARIMNFTKQNMEARIMKDIGKGDKGLMQAIQESMFVFDMLIMSDDKSLQTLLRMVDTDLLVLALKGADEPLQEKLFGCMSKRAAANIMDEMEALGPVRLTEVQSAQKEIINVARRLSDEGTIVLAGRGGDDLVLLGWRSEAVNLQKPRRVVARRRMVKHPRRQVCRGLEKTTQRLCGVAGAPQHCCLRSVPFCPCTAGSSTTGTHNATIPNLKFGKAWRRIPLRFAKH